MYTIRTLRVAELLSRVSARNCWFCVVVWAFRLLISRLCICVGCVFCFRLCWCLSEVHRNNIQPPTHAKSIDNSLLTTTTTTQCHSKIILKEEEEATEAIPNNRDTMPDHARRERGNLLHQRRCKWRHRASNNSREAQKLSNREDNTKPTLTHNKAHGVDTQWEIPTRTTIPTRGQECTRDIRDNNNSHGSVLGIQPMLATCMVSPMLTIPLERHSNSSKPPNKRNNPNQLQHHVSERLWLSRCVILCPFQKGICWNVSPFLRLFPFTA